MYMVLVRFQRMFPTQSDQFMNIYRLETEKPYGYIPNDNKPETRTGHKVLSNIFDKTLRYVIGEYSSSIYVEDQEELGQQTLMEEITDTTNEVADDNNISIDRGDTPLAETLNTRNQFSSFSRNDKKKVKKNHTTKRRTLQTFKPEIQSCGEVDLEDLD